MILYYLIVLQIETDDTATLVTPASDSGTVSLTPGTISNINSLLQSATTLVSNNYSNILILIGTALTLRGSLHYFVKSSEKNLLLPGLSDLRREDLLD